ncbi:hypothetical protein SK128_025565 [Halocaridina rubra]|uniref:Uncharacterized protein n=1 Tax=Halocaridina rubra TaxID=373956 RepID=A0AAN8XDV8_HALRR
MMEKLQEHKNGAPLPNDENGCETKQKGAADSALGELLNKENPVFKMRSIHNSQDSGLSSAEGSSSSGQTSQSNKSKFSPHKTSTPKKGVQFLKNLREYNILPSQMILDDPLLSSIDEPDCTDQEVKSLSTDDESTSAQWETQIQADKTLRTAAHSSASKLLTQCSNKLNIKRSHSFSGIMTHDSSKSDVLSLNKNSFDFPVSPSLKSRVRQRLYKLVNSIEGYEGKSEDNIICKGKMFKSPNETVASNPCVSVFGENIYGFDNMTHPSVSQLANCKTHLISCEDHRDRTDCKVNNISTHIFNASQRIDRTLSALLESQLQNLHLHQEQLHKVKMDSFQENQEADDRHLVYRIHLQQMLQLLEETEVRWQNVEKEKQHQKELFEEKIYMLSEKHKETLELQKLEYEKKIHDMEVSSAAIRIDTTKTCENKVSEILKFIREKNVALEKEHQNRVSELNNGISKLRDSNHLLEEKCKTLQLSFSKEKEEMAQTLKILEKKLSDASVEIAGLRNQARHMELKLREQQQEQRSGHALEEEVILLRAQLRDSETRFLREKQSHWHWAQKHSGEVDEIKERHEKEMLNYKLSMERERSLAISRAMVHREEEAKMFIKEIEKRYQELMRETQEHYKAQIEEYKKAVKILKQRVRKLEEENALKPF